RMSAPLTRSCLVLGLVAVATNTPRSLNSNVSRIQANDTIANGRFAAAVGRKPIYGKPFGGSTQAKNRAKQAANAGNLREIRAGMASRTGRLLPRKWTE